MVLISLARNGLLLTRLSGTSLGVFLMPMLRMPLLTEYVYASAGIPEVFGFISNELMVLSENPFGA